MLVPTIGRKRALSIAFVLAITAVFFSPISVHATVVLPLEVAELAAQSTHVVRGQIMANYVVPERGTRGEIYTRTDFRVLEYLQGDGPRELTIQQLGGQLGELTLQVSGNARLEPGREVIAFLDYDPARDLHFVVGLAQGVFEIDRTGPAPTVHRDLSGLSFYVVGAPPAPTLAQRQTLEEILRLMVIDVLAPGDDTPAGGLR